MSHAATHNMSYSVNLDGQLRKVYLNDIFMTDDCCAHRVNVPLYRDNAPAVLGSGVTVKGYFMRYSDNTTVLIEGELTGNVASVTLGKACYTKNGQFALVIKLYEGDTVSTIFYGEGTVFVSHTDNIIDPDGVIPSLDDLLAKISDMEAAASDGRAAAQEARDAGAQADAARLAIQDDLGQLKDQIDDQLELEDASNLNITPYAKRTSGGVTFNVNADNSISLEGVATSTGYVLPGFNYGDERLIKLEPGIYTISGSASGKILVYMVIFNDDGTSYKVYDNTSYNGYPTTFSIDDERYCYVQISVESGTDANGITLYPQIERGTVITEYKSPFKAYMKSERLERLEGIDNLFNKPIKLTEEDIENGAIKDGTGENIGTATNRRRTHIYIPMSAGSVVTGTERFNVFEYDLITKRYITDAKKWVTSYTVKNDCYIRILWYFVTPYDIVANTVFTSARQLRTVNLPRNSLTEIVKNTLESGYAQPSITVETISHRGRYGYDIGAECCKSAMVAAKRQGYKYVENDLRITSDGEFVMWHDTTLESIGDADHGVENYTLAELKEMDFGAYAGFTGEKILTFGEWVLAAKELGLGIYIHLKATLTDAQMEQAVRIVRRYGMLKYASWLGQGEKVRKYDPSARLCIMSAPTTANVETWSPYLDGGEVSFNPESELLTEENAALALDAGFGLECWYVDFGSTAKETIFAEIERVVALGIQRMTLDIYKVDDAFAEKYDL